MMKYSVIVGMNIFSRLNSYRTPMKRMVHRSAFLLSENHDILGVPVTATTAEIKEAYLKKCHKMHPDKHPDSKEMHSKFLKLNKAYDSLMNESQEYPTHTQSSNSLHGQAPPVRGSKGTPPNPKISSGFWKGFIVVCIFIPFFYSFASHWLDKMTYYRAAERAEIERIAAIKSAAEK